MNFNGLPVEPIYTLGMDVGQSWVVRPHESQFDLDNIHLATIPLRERSKGVEAIFQLDFLAIEGHARGIRDRSTMRAITSATLQQGPGRIAELMFAFFVA